MNWWQFGLLVVGILLLSWVIVSVTFGLMLMGIAGQVAGEIEARKPPGKIIVPDTIR